MMRNSTRSAMLRAMCPAVMMVTVTAVCFVNVARALFCQVQCAHILGNVFAVINFYNFYPTVKAEIFGGVLFSVTSVPTIFTENKTHRKFRYNRYCIHVVLAHLPGERVLPKISLRRTADFGEYRKYYTTENFCFYSSYVTGNFNEVPADRVDQHIVHSLCIVQKTSANSVTDHVSVTSFHVSSENVQWW